MEFDRRRYSHRNTGDIIKARMGFKFDSNKSLVRLRIRDVDGIGSQNGGRKTFGLSSGFYLL